MDMKLELVLIPVADVDRAKAFYTEKLGFSLDVDHQPNDDFRVAQMTPPGSACSVTVGIGLSDAAPGSYRGTHLVVTDVVAVHDELAARGVEVSDVKHMGPNGWEPGPDPTRSDFGSYVDFADPDGNTWILQEAGHDTAGSDSGS
jgi:catechol 2,3-dioxygenase-like lactoylglutathione lyase family enzyme